MVSQLQWKKYNKAKNEGTSLSNIWNFHLKAKISIPSIVEITRNYKHYQKLYGDERK